MSWKNCGPSREEYDTEEEYQEALEAYESTLDDYVEEYLERRREEG